MNIEEFCDRKFIAENKIRDIINELQGESGIAVMSCGVFMTTIRDETGRKIMSKCHDINLEVVL